MHCMHQVATLQSMDVDGWGVRWKKYRFGERWTMVEKKKLGVLRRRWEPPRKNNLVVRTDMAGAMLTREKETKNESIAGTAVGRLRNFKVPN